MKRFASTVRIFTLVICELLVVYTALTAIKEQDLGRLVPAIGSGLLVLLPLTLEYIFGFRLNLLLFTTCTFYTIGPMLGHCLRLYHTVWWWDKALHFYGGIVFALFGWFLYGLLSKEQGKKLLYALFAVFFSITLSVLWEFVEFGVDMLLHNDMMDDTLVTRVDSYLLGTETGEIGHIEGIRCVTVDGKEISIDGYIDIGLIDTMCDMLLETAGAIVAVLVCCVGNRSVGINKKTRTTNATDY